MAAPLEALLGNPVFVKELRVRMRGARAFWLLGVYLTVLAGVLFMTYSTWSDTVRMNGGYASSGQIGQSMFGALMGFEAFLVAFITPALTAGALTIEREQQTMDLLQMTRMSRGAIVAGKLGAAYAFIALLIISSVPLASICFLVGGVAPEQVAQVYLMLLASCLLTGALGIAWSSIASSTTVAVILTYGSMLVPGFLLMVLIGLAAGSGMGGQAPVWVGTVVFPVMQMMGIPLQSLGSSGSLVWDAGRFYGLSAPAWVPPVLVFGLAGTVLGAIAASRIESDRHRRAGALRLLVMMSLVVQLFFVYGAVFAPHWRMVGMAFGLSGSQTPIGVLIYPALLLLLCIPAFCTGEVTSADAGKLGNYLLHGWTKDGWYRASVASGAPYTLLLLVISLAMYVASFVAAGKPSAVLTGALGPRFLAAHGTGLLFGGYPEAVLCIVAMVAGLSALAMLISVAVRNRWAALALSYFVVAMILVAPAGSTISRSISGQGNQGDFAAYVSYLNPVVCISDICDSSQSFIGASGGLLGVGVPYWMISPLAYLLIAGLSMVLMIPVAAAQAAKVDPVPMAAPLERRTQDDARADA